MAIGSLATAGTLGILIPPSITMVVYAVAAEASIIRVFLAGFMPGFVLMALFSGYISWLGLLQPRPDAAARRRDRTFLREAAANARSLIPCMLLIVFVVWVLVAGWATATECAAYGVLGSLVMAWLSRTLTWQQLPRSLAAARGPAA